MVRKRAVPAYWRKNAVRQATRRACDRMEARRAEREAENNRKNVGQVIAWCMVIALHDLYGYGRKRFEGFAAALGEQADEYRQQVRALGPEKAKKQLVEQTAELVPVNYHLPLIRQAKTARERALWLEQRDAADLVLRMVAKTAHKLWGIGAGRAAAVLAETDTNYRQFLEYAREGDAYGYELLRRKAEEITGERLQVAREDGEKPVFAKSFY